jgi:dienelactone hydrolase
MMYQIDRGVIEPMPAAIGVLLIALFAAANPQMASAASAPEQVHIARPDVALNAMLYRPDGDGPFPAVVALHGCAGLGKNGIAERYRDWAERLTNIGFVVLFPDSFGSRGLGSQCRVSKRGVRASRERVADANAARRWLQDQPFVRPDRVFALGWSNGATTVLYAIRGGPSSNQAHPDFRSAVALYPGCRKLNTLGWSARVPTLILIGAADDWTPAKACEQMVAGARGRSAQVAITVYPGAYHGFDEPNLPVKILSGVASSADGSGRVHRGTNPQARADALKRVSEWLLRFAQDRAQNKLP